MTILLLFCMAMGISWAAAGEIPAWLDNASQDPRELADDPGKRVWLVVGSDGEKALADVAVMAVSVIIPSSSKDFDYLYDQYFDYEHGGERFRFSREDIAHIRYYSRVTFQTAGPPTSYHYAPRIHLKNGETLDETPQRIFPMNALKPNRFRYERVEVARFHGKSKERRKISSLTRPILAMAWTRGEAEEAREQILLRYARNESRRLHIDWGQRVTVLTPERSVAVEPHAHYEISNEGGYNSWIEKTKGTIEVLIDGREYTWDFSNTCRDLVHASRCIGCVTCGPQVRVHRWEDDPSGLFQKLLFGTRGIEVFYTTGNNPLSAADVDSQTIEVGFELQVE